MILSRSICAFDTESRYCIAFEPWLGGWIEARRGTISLMLESMDWSAVVSTDATIRASK